MQHVLGHVLLSQVARFVRSLKYQWLSGAAHFSANSLTHQSYLEVSGSHQLHFWLKFLIFYKLFLDKLQGNNFFWSKDGLDTREVPSRAKNSSACQGLARGPWISGNHFRYHHWHIKEGSLSWNHQGLNLYVGVFLLPGSFQHLFLTRVVSTTYFLLKTRAHEIQ